MFGAQLLCLLLVPLMDVCGSSCTTVQQDDAVDWFFLLRDDMTPLMDSMRLFTCFLLAFRAIIFLAARTSLCHEVGSSWHL